MKAIIRNCGLACVIALGVALSGCATKASVGPEARAVQKVGVLSLAGGYLTQKNVGITVFGNEDAELDISSWRLDQAFAETMAAALREKTSYDAIVIPAPPSDLQTLFRPAANTSQAVDLDARWARGEDAFKRVAAENRVDALFVMIPRFSGDYFNFSNQTLRGLGIYTRSLGDRTGTSALHLISGVAIISGKTGKVVGHAVTSPVPLMSLPASGRLAQASIMIPASLARKPITSMTDEEKEQVRKLALTLPLKSAMDLTVRELFP